MDLGNSKHQDIFNPTKREIGKYSVPVPKASLRKYKDSKRTRKG